MSVLHAIFAELFDHVCQLKQSTDDIQHCLVIVLCLKSPERLISRPYALVILRKWVGQIYETHAAAKEGGRYTTVVYTFKST